MAAVRSDEDLITSKELADLLRVSIWTVYHWRMRGEGPAGVRVGHRVRYRVRDVYAWLDQREGYER